MKTVVVIEKCSSYERGEVLAAVRRCCDELGGIEKFVRPGQKVLLKPNLLTGATPERAVVTHPEIVRAAAVLAKDAGAEVLIGDSPCIATLKKALSDSSYDAVIAELGLRVQPFEDVRAVETGAEGFQRSIEIAAAPLDADAVINLPKLKTHAQMYMTLAVKNLFGCVAGKRKIEWHFKAERHYEHFAKVLVHVAKAVSPALTIVDGVLAMEGNGPNAGTPRQLGVIVAGTDCVAVDAVICEMLSLNPDMLYTHRVAREIGWGVGELREIELRGVPLEEVRVKDWQPARAVDILMRIPGFLRRWLKRLFTSRPKVNRNICEACGVCGSVCPVKAITAREKMRINYDKCICCFCCQEICPYGAIGVKDGLFVRLLRKRTGLRDAFTNIPLAGHGKRSHGADEKR
jgi:uncharacterized protein (DUF362 family)/Pyruvate/2-oxoacid:ferredoxin oxidoreductase delta subunit